MARVNKAPHIAILGIKYKGSRYTLSVMVYYVCQVTVCIQDPLGFFCDQDLFASIVYVFQNITLESSITSLS